ncbi:MAG TPA: radical SAM protein, partial [Bryobacteraceae bacterium]|nr:radical SAM protein [Bryobacteraceae bacterium]
EFMELHESDDFEDRIYAKSQVADILRQEVRHLARGAAIAIGTATDPYQPAERRFERTRSIIEVFTKCSDLSIHVTTKSDLAPRDIDLFQEVARHNQFNVNITITTLDRELARKLEPRAPRPDLRLKAVRKLADAGISVGVVPNPIMPLITDQEPRLDRLAKAARDHGASYFGGGILFLQPCSRRVFLPFVEKNFPHLLRRYQERYESSAYLKGAYPEMIRERIGAIRSRYGLDNYPGRPQIPSDQAGLFER